MDKTELYNIDRKILKSAGFYGGAQQDVFIRENPGAAKLYAKTYELTNDKELQAKFRSKNRKVVAAMLLASQKLIDNHPVINKIGTDRVHKAAVDAKLKEYYEASLAEIEADYVDISNPEEFSRIDSSTRIQKAKAENADIIEKQAKALPKVSSFSLKVACGATKTCELKKFRIDLAPKKEKEVSVPSFSFFSSKEGIIQNLINAAMDTESADNIIDIFNSTKSLEEIHLVGGKLNYFQQNIKVVAKGTCEHGKAATSCPQVRIRSTGTSIDKTGSRDLWLNNTDEQLLNTRLFPHDNASIEPELSIKGMLALLRDHSGKYQSTYDFEVKSCQGNEYTGYYSRLVVHRPNVIKFGLKWKLPLYGDGGKTKHSFDAEIYSRMDEKEFKHRVSLNSGIKDIIRNIIPGPPWLTTLLTGLQFTLNRLSALGSDEGESPALKITEDEAPEEYPEITPDDIPEDRGASIQPIEIHIAYRRILKPQPKLNYNSVAYHEELYFAASPLLQYKKTVNVLNAIWKSCIRGSMATATAGVSEAIIAANKEWGITEGISGAFDEVGAALREMAKSSKLSQSSGVQDNTDKLITISDEEVSVYLGTKNTGVGAKAKCLLEMSMAAETDNPGNGIVFSREPGQKYPALDKGASGFYAGVNFQVTGEVSGNLRLLKMIGCQPKDISAGVKLEVLSADNTAPVRLGVDFCLDKNFIENAEAHAKSQIAIADAADKVKEETRQAARTTPLDEYDKHAETERTAEAAENFAKKARKTANKAVKNIAYAREQQAKADANPLGMNASFLFSGIAVYFSAYIEVKRFSAEGDDTINGFGAEAEEDKITNKSDVVSETTKIKKFSIGIMNANNIKPTWSPLPFNDFFNKI